MALITSYLFGMEPVHLNDFVDSKSEVLSSSWTLRGVPGKRYGAKDVYVLTSSKTFSAAEEFAYNLRNLNRATLIGERTGGGANPVSMFQLGHSFTAMISTAQARNPISGTNWERIGVEPHVEVPAEQALETAYKTALAKLQRTADPAREQAKVAALQD
ncbi:hypothetical protein BH20VER1_BH20VER1_11840 [soil metagenome]